MLPVRHQIDQASQRVGHPGLAQHDVPIVAAKLCGIASLKALYCRKGVEVGVNAFTLFGVELGRGLSSSGGGSFAGVGPESTLFKTLGHLHQQQVLFAGRTALVAGVLARKGGALANLAT